jgi:hypothetical protein
MMVLSPLLIGTAMANGNESGNKSPDCNKQAQGMTGNERHRTIATCMRRNSATSSTSPLLARITDCNQKAGSMTGDDRVKFVDRCLSGQ